ncbi:long-chain fatty acid--CoA ligase, partial [Bacteroides fragilis]
MMDLSHSPLLQAISNNAEKFANRVALIEGNSQVSYSELWKKIIDAASFLCYIGLQYGDNIILSARKELEFVYIYFGAHLLGVRNVVIDPTSNDERKQYL